MKHLRHQCLLLLTALLCLLVSLPSCSKRKTAEELLQEAIVQQYQCVGKLLLTETTLQKAVTLQLGGELVYVEVYVGASLYDVR